ncbi:MAG: ABC transporter ATP-binding protein [Phycisphaeraceae bacterium]|nr:ABC transporter ATP-binding protein [Phycisphaeraceae bacterium]
MEQPPPNAQDSAVLEITDLRREYPQRKAPPTVALGGVSLTLERGGMLALLGPNGAGKSTLMRCIATIDRPTSGALRILGHDPASGAAALRAIRAGIGVVFQHHGLDPLLTVEENLVNQAACFGLTGDDARSRARKAAVDLGVADRLKSRVGELSGGLARRVDLARALLHQPKLLLLDEPTTGLDHAARASFLTALERRHAAGGLSIIMSTHLMDEAQRMQRVALIDHGKVIAQGRPEELCREVGGLLLRTDADLGAELESAGLHVRTVGMEAVGAGDKQLVLDTAERLARRAASGDGVSRVVVGPPTLGDAYLALTGAALDEPEHHA